MNACPTGLTKRLADFVVGAQCCNAPASVGHEAKRAVLNFFGVAFSGSRDPAIEIAVSSLMDVSDSRQATIIGRLEKVDILSAAFLNAASANVADFDDTHIPTVIHPTAPVAPALFAIAERRRLSGADLLAAFALGVEIECRIGRALSPEHYRRGWHITATCGVLGAAVAAGKTLGLDSDQMVHAIGNAATQSAGLVESIGSMAKSISVGNSCRNGLWAAMLAQKGFTAPPNSLEGPNGFFRVMSDRLDVASLLSGLGDIWELSHNAIKPYPCGVVINPVVDCCLAIRAAAPLASHEIERVTIRCNPLLVQRADRPTVTSSRVAQVSVQHIASFALLFGRPKLECLAEPYLSDCGIAALRDRFELHASANFEIDTANVVVTSVDGRIFAAEANHMRDGHRAPFSDADLEAKVEDLVADRMRPHAVRRLIDAIWNLDSSSDATELLRLARP